MTTKTTPLSNDEIVIVTHPFLPHSGKQFILIARLRPRGKEKLLCQDLDGNEFLIPIEYTNLKKQDFFRDLANDRCDFRYDDLRNLAALIEEIRRDLRGPRCLTPTYQLIVVYSLYSE